MLNKKNKILLFLALVIFCLCYYFSFEKTLELYKEYTNKEKIKEKFIENKNHYNILLKKSSQLNTYLKNYSIQELNQQNLLLELTKISKKQK